MSTYREPPGWVLHVGFFVFLTAFFAVVYYFITTDPQPRPAPVLAPTCDCRCRCEVDCPDPPQSKPE